MQTGRKSPFWWLPCKGMLCYMRPKKAADGQMSSLANTSRSRMQCHSSSASRGLHVTASPASGDASMAFDASYDKCIHRKIPNERDMIGEALPLAMPGCHPPPERLVQPVQSPQTAEDHQHLCRQVLLGKRAHFGKESADPTRTVARWPTDGLYALLRRERRSRIRHPLSRQYTYHYPMLHTVHDGRKSAERLTDGQLPCKPCPSAAAGVAPIYSANNLSSSLTSSLPPFSDMLPNGMSPCASPLDSVAKAAAPDGADAVAGRGKPVSFFLLPLTM